MTDPLGNDSIYQLDRDTVSSNVKVTSISGDCPTCGLGPNTQLFYDDPNHPMLPTRTVDGRGYTTAMSYTAFGRVESRTEAMGEPEERTTTWTYDATFPALVESIEQPSVAGGGALRMTDFPRDGSGNAYETTISGVEAGGAFSYTTETTFNAAGMPRDDRPAGPRHRRRDDLHLRPGPGWSRRRLPDRPDRRHDHLRPRPLPPAGLGHRPERRRDRDRLRPSRPGDRGAAGRRQPADGRPGDHLRVHRLRRSRADDPAGGQRRRVLVRCGRTARIGGEEAGRPDLEWDARRAGRLHPGRGRSAGERDAPVVGPGGGWRRGRLGDVLRDRLRLLDPLPPRPDDPGARDPRGGGHRVRVRLQRQPLRPVGREPRRFGRSADHELFL